VFAATTVELGEVVVRVDRVGLDTAVGRIVQAIEATADEKSEIQAFAERLADRDVGRTLGLACWGRDSRAASMPASPFSSPTTGGGARRHSTAIVSSIGQAFRQDILIKSPRVLENLARVDTVVFDKTGTLTLGAPRVTRIARYGSLSEEPSSGWWPPPSGRSVTLWRVPSRAWPPSGGSRRRRRRPPWNRSVSASRCRSMAPTCSSAAADSWSPTRWRCEPRPRTRRPLTPSRSPLFVAIDGRLEAMLVCKINSATTRRKRCRPCGLVGCET